MTPKRLWLITLLLLLIYISTYISLAMAGIQNYSRHFSWQENLGGSILLILFASAILAALVALIPFPKKKISDRFFHFYFPLIISIFTILIGLLSLMSLPYMQKTGYPFDSRSSVIPPNR